uniref:DNA polymerase III, delta subunit n=1 Tax=Megaviridae environmental sample TaxID=1737588 RepID=A0A5J6VK28_9VIRU|nr:MAG: DNA polymerase III, delta subunit [Megaviridae environmental sample]
MLWLDKYRPTTFDDLLQDSSHILQNYIHSNDRPHLLITGPVGTGKTCACNILKKQMFGDKVKHQVLELTAADDRGIKVVRQKIKSFAHTYVDSTCTPNIKLVILDEADILTDESQFSLRRIIEDYSQTTRFILICNDINNIIVPLVSRCSVIMFTPYSRNKLLLLINNILKKEEMELIDSDKNKLLDINSIPKIINHLQMLKNCNCILDDLLSNTHHIPEQAMKAFQGTNSSIFKLGHTLIADGFMVDEIMRSLWENIDIDPRKRYKLSKILCDIAIKASLKASPLITIVAILFAFKASV